MIRDIEDSILIVVSLGTAVPVLKAVGILGHVRATVDGVLDRILVVVDIGATIRVLEAVTIFGKLGTLVVSIKHPVVVDVVLARSPANGERAAHGSIAKPRDRRKIDTGKQ